MPLGGIGTGSIAIGGDGLLKQWQITNTVRHNAFVPNSFFGVWVKKEGEPNDKAISRALICPKIHEDPSFKPAESVSDHKIPLAAKEMFEILPGVEEIVFNGEYPIAFLDFLDDSFPIEISLMATTPFIPLDPKNSGLPLIVFQFQLHNTSNDPCEVSLIGNFLNLLGWDGLKVFKGTESMLFGGNENKHKEIGDWHAIEMKSKSLLRKDKRFGDLTFAINQPDAMVLNQWDDLKTFWNYFSLEGKFPSSVSEEISPIGHTWVGSLGSRKIINPGEKVEIEFYYTWNFPNRVKDWVIDKSQIPDENTEFWIGNRYNEWFKNSISVMNYFQQNFNYLMKKTEILHEVFYTMELPPEVLMSIIASVSTIRTPTCFWMRDGSFHGFEGCKGASPTYEKYSGGCCPLDCTHVWNYEFSLAYLFPSLERTMRETEFKTQHDSGYIPHRSVIPMYLPQLRKNGDWDMIGPAIDGMFGTILKIYRDFLITADLDFLKKSWPNIDKLINYIFENYDKDKIGVIYSEQPNTYDCTLYGNNTFIGSLYLTTLLSCEKIAKLLNLSEDSKKFREIFTSGKIILDQECWNGEYYIQKYDKDQIKEHQYGIGCHSDQLIGQWWAFHLGLGYILPPEHVKKAIDSIVKYNFKNPLKDIDQVIKINKKIIEVFRIFASETDSGILNCTWPHGGKPSIPILYSNEVFTGIEYEIAALCIYTGKYTEASHILKAIRKRYDGTRRNPWNEVECGDHYVRAMSSWTLLNAATGVVYINKVKQFQIRPRINAENTKCFYITNTAWGQIILRVDNKIVCSVSVSYGELEINSLILNHLEPFKLNNGSVLIKEIFNGEEILLEAKIAIKNRKAELFLKQSIVLKEDHQLYIELK
ncbi:MAG: GH116 family glycosyl-hydrolase [Promethearchaeota archaeon]